MLRVRSLSSITTPKAVSAFQVSPVTGGRPRWSAPCPWPAAQEVPYPALLRFRNRAGEARWADVLVDPDHVEAQSALILPRKDLYQAMVNREQWRQQQAASRQRALARLEAKVRELEERVAQLEAQQQKDPGP